MQDWKIHCIHQRYIVPDQLLFLSPNSAQVRFTPAGPLSSFSWKYAGRFIGVCQCSAHVLSGLSEGWLPRSSWFLLGGSVGKQSVCYDPFGPCTTGAWAVSISRAGSQARFQLLCSPLVLCFVSNFVFQILWTGWTERTHTDNKHYRHCIHSTQHNVTFNSWKVL